MRHSTPEYCRFWLREYSCESCRHGLHSTGNRICGALMGRHLALGQYCRIPTFSLDYAFNLRGIARFFFQGGKPRDACMRAQLFGFRMYGAVNFHADSLFHPRQDVLIFMNPFRLVVELSRIQDSRVRRKFNEIHVPWTACCVPAIGPMQAPPPAYLTTRVHRTWMRREKHEIRPSISVGIGAQAISSRSLEPVPGNEGRRIRSPRPAHVAYLSGVGLTQWQRANIRQRHAGRIRVRARRRRPAPRNRRARPWRTPHIH